MQIISAQIDNIVNYIGNASMQFANNFETKLTTLQIILENRRRSLLIILTQIDNIVNIFESHRRSLQIILTQIGKIANCFGNAKAQFTNHVDSN